MDKELIENIIDFILNSKDDNGCSIFGMVDGFLLENKFFNDDTLYEEDNYYTRDNIIDDVIASINSLKN